MAWKLSILQIRSSIGAAAMMDWIRRILIQNRRVTTTRNHTDTRCPAPVPEQEVQIYDASHGYLTPARQEEFRVSGAVYGADFLIRLESLRNSTRAIYRHVDPAYVWAERFERIREISGELLYLGHAFQHYGHFLLETLPMLSYPMNMRRRNITFIFSPLFHAGDHSLLYQVLDLLGLGAESVLVHDTDEVWVGNFSVARRPIIINSTAIDVRPYHQVIDAIKNRIGVRNSATRWRRLFLTRDARYLDNNYVRCAEECFSEVGFKVIRPEQFPFKEQIQLAHGADLIAGFAGSALHNAIFAKEGSMVIELGDNRSSPDHGLFNQMACQIISRSQLAYIPYSPSDPLAMQSLVHRLV